MVALLFPFGFLCGVVGTLVVLDIIYLDTQRKPLLMPFSCRRDATNKGCRTTHCHIVVFHDADT